MLTFLALLVLIVKAPFLLLLFLFKHRALVVMAIIIVVVIIGIGIFQSRTKSIATSTEVPPSMATTMPDMKIAPIVVQTTSRIYIVSKMTTQEDGVTLLDYFVYDSKKWEHRTQPLELNQKSYGEIKVYDR